MAVPAVLTHCQVFITYVPLRTELDFSEFFSIPAQAIVYEILPRAALDPRTEALGALTAAGTLPTAVLMPGRRFDTLGTRHGQGGGWYDRFLARVPDSWLRVGFCSRERLSDTPLKREPWDQPMDYLCVEGSWIKTNARSGILE